MAMSPLTMSLLGGGAGMMSSPYAMGMYNPAALGAMQRLQLGGGLINQGLDSSAAYPMQAVSRLGQALIGSLMLKKGYGDLQAAGQQNPVNSDALDKFIWGPSGNPALAPAASSTPQAAAAPAAPPAVASGAPPAIPRDKSMTAGMQANNPGNLMYAGQPDATGTIPVAGGRQLAAFPDMPTGVAADVRQLAVNADQHGVKSVRQMVSRWVGDPKADLTGYVNDTAKAIGVDPDAPVNWHDPNVQTAFLTAQYPHESAGGSTGLNPADVAAGVKLAAAGGVPKGTQYAQAGNIATDAVPGAAAPQGQQGAAQGPQVGLQSPRVQAITGAITRARQVLAAHPYPLDPVHLQAQTALENAQQQLTIGAWQPLPNGAGSINTVTGQITYAPVDRPTMDVHGNTLAVGPGGQSHTLATNPSGITGNTPDANAMRILAELGPKVANGTATPQEQANYATAAEVYQGSQIHTGPGNQLLRIPVRPMPEGMPAPGAPMMPPQPGGAQPQGAAPQIQIPQGGAPALGGAQLGAGVTPLTGPGTGIEAAKAITQAAGEADEKNAAERQSLVMKNHDILGTTATIRSLLPQVTTGVGADQRLKAAQVLTALGVPQDTAKQWIGTAAAPGEVLQKKLFELTTGAVRGMGAREPGSVMMMFQKNYPQMSSRNMTTDAMSRLLDMDQVYQEDEVAGQRSYLGDQVGKVAQGGKYEGLTGYQQPDPRLYQAAALATGGMPYSVWSQGLTPQQQTSALKLGARVYPDASALDAKGVRHVFQAPQNGQP